MSTASVYKGSVALLTQALRAADHYGVLDHVLSDLGELRRTRAGGSRGSAAKADRYVGEMHEIARRRQPRGSTPRCSRRWRRCGRRSPGRGSRRSPRRKQAPTSPEALRQLALGERELPERLEVREADADEA